jgi:hypothetical protein
MFTPLAKLAIGLSATMATAFYYLAAAPSASAQNVCGPENFSPLCVRRRASLGLPPSLAPIPEPVQEVPVVESPAVIADPVQEVPVVESPAVIADPVQEVPAIEPAVIAPPGDGYIYPPRPGERPPTAIPEPGTVVALLVTGAGIICCGRKRNKQVRQQR